MKLIIYHGKQGTGKTTQLEVAAYYNAGDCDVQQIIKERLVVTNHGQRSQYIDEFNFKTDLKLIDPTACDWIFIATQNLPKDYGKKIFKKFGMEVDVFAVRETMFPLCNYMFEEIDGVIADFGAMSEHYYTREDLIKKLSINPSKEVTIEDVESMALFLEQHGTIRPKNFGEWGLDWYHLQVFGEKFRNMTDNKLMVTENEACAIVNFNGCEIPWIEDTFFSLFVEE